MQIPSGPHPGLFQALSAVFQPPPEPARKPAAADAPAQTLPQEEQTPDRNARRGTYLDITV